MKAPDTIKISVDLDTNPALAKLRALKAEAQSLRRECHLIRTRYFFAGLALGLFVAYFITASLYAR